MKKAVISILLATCLILSFILVACNNNNGGENSRPTDYTRPSNANIDNSFMATGDTLIAYFSQTSNTKSVAEKIRELTDADIFEIDTAQPYTAQDLNYSVKNNRPEVERNTNARPELAVYLPDEVIAQYDTIILGYPVWWHTAPMAVLSFLNYYDLSGKIIYTFCTSGGSSISESTVDVRNNASGATVTEGQRFRSGSDESIKTWLDNLGLSLTPDSPQVPTVPDDAEEKSENILIVYFSWSGNTVGMANYIHGKIGGAIVEIEAAVPYSGSYNDVAYGRAHEEWQANARPEVAKSTYDKIDIGNYDTVFIGFPIWWHTAPMIIGTFLEHYQWTEEIHIYPFFQGASNSNNEYYSNSMEFVRGSASGATIHDGLYAAASNSGRIDEYLNSYGF